MMRSVTTAVVAIPYFEAFSPSPSSPPSLCHFLVGEKRKEDEVKAKDENVIEDLLQENEQIPAPSGMRVVARHSTTVKQSVSQRRRRHRQSFYVGK